MACVLLDAGRKSLFTDSLFLALRVLESFWACRCAVRVTISDGFSAKGRSGGTCLQRCACPLARVAVKMKNPGRDHR
jgi:hypothetical protein